MPSQRAYLTAATVRCRSSADPPLFLGVRGLWLIPTIICHVLPVASSLLPFSADAGGAAAFSAWLVRQGLAAVSVGRAGGRVQLGLLAGAANLVNRVVPCACAKHEVCIGFYQSCKLDRAVGQFVLSEMACGQLCSKGRSHACLRCTWTQMLLSDTKAGGVKQHTKVLKPARLYVNRHSALHAGDR